MKMLVSMGNREEYVELTHDEIVKLFDDIVSGYTDNLPYCFCNLASEKLGVDYEEITLIEIDLQEKDEAVIVYEN